MKHRISNLVTWILGGGLLLIFLTILETKIAKLITQNEPEKFDTLFILMALFTLLIYAIIVSVKIVQFYNYSKKYKQEYLKKAKKELNSEFKTVLRNGPVEISSEQLECQAKIDDNGKIICRIHVDCEIEMDSYEDFIDCFHFDED